MKKLLSIVLFLLSAVAASAQDDSTFRLLKVIKGDIVEFEVECNIHLSYVIIELLSYQSMSTYKPQI